MDREKAKELAIFESEKYAHQNGFGKEKSKLQSAFLAGFELAFKNNVDLHNVSQQRELLDWLSNEPCHNIRKSDINEILQDFKYYQSNCG